MMKALEDITTKEDPKSLIGLPYKWRGGMSDSGKGSSREPLSDTDCSTFVANFISRISKGHAKLPDLTDAMIAKTTPVDPKDAQPLDLIFYNYPGENGPGGHIKYGHVAILVDVKGTDPHNWKVLDQSTDPIGPTGKTGVDIRPADHPLRNGGQMIIRRIPDRVS